MNKVVVIGSGRDIDLALIEGLKESDAEVIHLQYFDNVEDILDEGDVNHGYLVLNTKIDVDSEEIRDPLIERFNSYEIPLTVVYTVVETDSLGVRL